MDAKPFGGRPAHSAIRPGIIGGVGTSHPGRQMRNGQSPRPRGNGRFSEARVGSRSFVASRNLNHYPYSGIEGKVRDVIVQH